MSSATMSDIDSHLEKEMVYLAYRDVFKDSLAKIRKRSKVRNMMAIHKDHLHQKHVADSMDSEKTCRILRELLSARLFESESAAKAVFPALFSPRELGDDTALIVKCIRDGPGGRSEHVDERILDAPLSSEILPSLATAMPNDTSLQTAPMVSQQHTNTELGVNSTSLVIEMEGKEASAEEVVVGEGAKGKNVLKRKRGSNYISINPTYLPSRLQHSILSQTQQLLEECCYKFAEKWLPSMLETKGWDAPEAVELTKLCKALSKCDIPAEAITLHSDQPLEVLFKRAIALRHCAVHRRPQIPVKKLEAMVRDAWMLSQALQDDLRAEQLLKWHKELENLVAHLQLSTDSQREAVEAELRNIHNTKAEIEERLAELESRERELTRSLEIESKTHRPIDDEVLRSLDEALGSPALVKTLS